MNLSSLKNIQAYSAQSLGRVMSGFSLNFGSPYSRNNKLAQNQLVSENLLRKSAQLVQDILSIRKSSGVTLKTDSDIAKDNMQDAIAQSIEDIMDIRARLNIETPEGKNIKPLEELFKPRGSVLDQKS